MTSVPKRTSDSSPTGGLSGGPSSPTPPPSTPRSLLRPVTWGSALAVLGGMAFFYTTTFDKRKEEIIQQIPRQGAAGRAAVGGPFSLVDSKNRPFTDKDLLGSFALVYFGFTFCPDICPDELDKITDGLNLADKDSPNVLVQPVFISIDPERDTPEVVGTYLQDFHPRFIGLTGTVEQVKAAARAYRVYYHKTNETNGDYLVDHSIIMYMIDPNGDFLTFFGRNNTAEDIAEVVGRNIREWRRQNPQWRVGETTRVRSSGPHAG
jgi:protein SCO1